MVFIAIAVPLMIVTAALYFYNQKGRSDQYTGYYNLAIQSRSADPGPDRSQRAAQRLEPDALLAG